MNLKTMFTISFVFFLLLGLGFVLFPEFALTQSGVDPDNNIILVTRELGAVTLGFAVISWMARSAGPSKARDGIVAAIVLTSVVLGIVDALAIVSGVSSSTNWVFVAISALLAIGFAVTGRAAMASGS